MTNVGLAGESTALGDAIMQSIRTLSYGEANNKAIILLTDGYHNAGKTSPKDAVKKAKALGIKIYTIGIGKKSDYDVALLKPLQRKVVQKVTLLLQPKPFQRSMKRSILLNPVRYEVKTTSTKDFSYSTLWLWYLSYFCFGYLLTQRSETMSTSLSKFFMAAPAFGLAYMEQPS